MIFNVHAGHNPAGKVACGAVASSSDGTLTSPYVLTVQESLTVESW